MEPAEWRFFLVGKVEGLVKVTSQNGNPAPNWLSDKSWGEILSLASIKTFADLPVKFVEELSQWHAFFLSRDPHLEKFPGNWNEKLSSFQKILLLRCIRPDKLTHAIRNFIASSFLGPKFVEPPVFDLLAIYKNSVAITPLIFLLSEDVSDPRGLVVELAQKVKIPEKMVVPLSLGQVKN